jgi:hypothetical protein
MWRYSNRLQSTWTDNDCHGEPHMNRMVKLGSPTRTLHPDPTPAPYPGPFICSVASWRDTGVCLRTRRRRHLILTDHPPKSRMLKLSLREAKEKNIQINEK